MDEEELNILAFGLAGVDIHNTLSSELNTNETYKEILNNPVSHMLFCKLKELLRDNMAYEKEVKA